MNKKLVAVPLFGVLALSFGVMGSAQAMMGKDIPKKTPIACAYIADPTLAEAFQCPPKFIVIPPVTLPVIPPPVGVHHPVPVSSNSK